MQAVVTKPRLCAKLPKPRRMGCAPDGVKVERVPGEMSFLEFCLAMNQRDKEEEQKPADKKDVLVWADIMRQVHGGL